MYVGMANRTRPRAELRTWSALEHQGPRRSSLRDHFLLDNHLQMRGHVFVQLHRHGELAQGLQRLVELDPPLGLKRRNVKGSLEKRAEDGARASRSFPWPPRARP